MAQPSKAVQEYCKRRGFSERVCDGGLDYLLEDWKKIVHEVVTGYYALFYEYLNDMDGRRIISELLPLADEAELNRVQESLAELDHAFLNATRRSQACIWGEEQAAKQGYAPDRDWWYYRVPTSLDFAEDRDAWPLSE